MEHIKKREDTAVIIMNDSNIGKVKIIRLNIDVRVSVL